MLSLKAYLLSILVLAFVIDNSEAQKSLCSSNKSVCKADETENWTYRGKNGPPNWGNKYKDCDKKSQSPINIDTKEVETDMNLELELENYDVPLTKARIINNGHTIEVQPNDGESRTVTIGGNVYELVQFHFHWGCNPQQGSEHTVNGQAYAMEVHFVHANEEGQLAVVGVFFKESSEPGNAALSALINQLTDVTYKGTETELTSSMNLDDMLPSNTIESYFRYRGSLTTPKCSEIVTWTVVKDPITCSKEQMDKLRGLYSTTEDKAEEGCKMAGNYRPVQQLNGRTVYYYSNEL